MREMPPQREIVVPGDMRRAGGGKASPRRAAALRPNATRGEVMASLGASARSLGALCLRRPGHALGSVVSLGAAIYISINALGFQAGRHPAPILPQPKGETVAQSEPSRAPAPVRIIAEPTRERPAPASEPAPSHDAIGSMLRSAGETTASVTPKPDKAIMQAQRALSKLGYGPLKDDGMMGPGTKAAIEKFERDRKLPVKGEAAGRTLKELAARSAQAKPKG